MDVRSETHYRTPHQSPVIISGNSVSTIGSVNPKMKIAVGRLGNKNTRLRNLQRKGRGKRGIEKRKKEEVEEEVEIKEGKRRGGGA